MIVGIVSFIALIYCSSLLITQLFSKHTKGESSKLLICLSNTSLLLMTLSTVFICLTYFAPYLWSHECQCHILWSAALVCYVGSLYLIKASYFSIIYLLNQSHVFNYKQTDINLYISAGSLVITMIICQVMMITLTDGECYPVSAHKPCSVLSFHSADIYFAMLILIIDSFLFGAFCYRWFGALKTLTKRRTNRNRLQIKLIKSTTTHFILTIIAIMSCFFDGIIHLSIDETNYTLSMLFFLFDACVISTCSFCMVKKSQKLIQRYFSMYCFSESFFNYKAIINNKLLKYYIHHLTVDNRYKECGVDSRKKSSTVIGLETWLTTVRNRSRGRKNTTAAISKYSSSIFSKSLSTTKSTTISKSLTSTNIMAKIKNTKFPQFVLDPLYRKDSEIIYVCLMKLKLVISANDIAQRIAEYAATNYRKCTECHQTFAYIECIKDICIVNDALAYCDPYCNNEVKYYLDCDPFSGELNTDDHYDENIGVLCVECGEKWKCEICSTQFLTCNHEQWVWDSCDVCNCVVCQDCSAYYEQQILCAKCQPDGVSSGIVTASGKSRKSKSSSNNLSKWGGFDFEF